MMARLFLTISAFAILGATVSTQTHAQPYPQRPIQLVVPFAVGQVTDIVARAFGERMSAEFGQPFVVINREGAGGTLGFAAAASAAPDGHTLVFSPQGALTIQPHVNPKLPYRVDAFAPVCQVFESAFAVVVGRTSPIADFNDLVARARAKPKSLTWGTLGIATIPTIQFMGLAKATGIELVARPVSRQRAIHPGRARWKDRFRRSRRWIVRRVRCPGAHHTGWPRAKPGLSRRTHRDRTRLPSFDAGLHRALCEQRHAWRRARAA